MFFVKEIMGTIVDVFRAATDPDYAAQAISEEPMPSTKPQPLFDFSITLQELRSGRVAKRVGWPRGRSLVHEIQARGEALWLLGTAHNPQIKQIWRPSPDDLLARDWVILERAE